MLKELGLVVTGVTIGVVGTLYVTKDFLIEGFAHKLSEVIDEEVQDMKDEQVERDHKRDYTKPLRKYGKYPWVEQVERDHKRDYTKPLRKYGKYPWGEPKSCYTEAKEEEIYALPMLMASREEAVKVLNTLLEMIDIYHVVSVADYYDLVAVVTTYKNNLYGWVDGDLTDARVVPLDDAFVIKLPAAKRLNK